MSYHCGIVIIDGYDFFLKKDVFVEIKNNKLIISRGSMRCLGTAIPQLIQFLTTKGTQAFSLVVEANADEAFYNVKYDNGSFGNDMINESDFKEWFANHCRECAEQKVSIHDKAYEFICYRIFTEFLYLDIV